MNTDYIGTNEYDRQLNMSRGRRCRTNTCKNIKRYASEQNTIYDPTRNLIQVRHVPGTVYTDVLVTCLLDYGEPSTQSAFDNSTSYTDSFVFDELGLKSYSLNGPDTGNLLTHVIFHPVQKSLNRLIQIDYTVRIQTLTNLSSIG